MEVLEDGLNAQERLEKLTWEGAETRYPEGLPDNVATQLRHELNLIERMAYAPYFLTVESIVRFARSKGILCQGRGSAANSAVYIFRKTKRLADLTDRPARAIAGDDGGERRARTAIGLVTDSRRHGASLHPPARRQGGCVFSDTGA
jgi:hypothetical protein